MGVKGLLPALQSITKQVSLEKYHGLTAAIDAMCWLHKGLFTGDTASLAKYQFLVEKIEASFEASHAKKSVCSKNENDSNHGDVPVKRLDFENCLTQRKQRKKESAKETIGNELTNPPDHVTEMKNNAHKAISDCVDYVIRQTVILQNEFGIEPILVIDGDELPSKSRTNAERKLARVKAFEDALNLERKQNFREARKYFAKACSITHEIRHELIVQCRHRKISYMIAPYESDAQLASIAHSGVADLVITEDSDLLAYAVPRVLFKVDLKAGRGNEIQIMRDLATNEGLNFRHWNHDMFVYMCILTGCDYCVCLPGIGLQIAHKLVRIHRVPSKIFNAIKQTGKWREGFENDFWIAYRTFRHQRIFCTLTQSIRNLFPIQNVSSEETEKDINLIWSFLGRWIEPESAVNIANGSFHPKEKMSWDDVIRKTEADWRDFFKSNASIYLMETIYSRTGVSDSIQCHKMEPIEKKRSHISPIKENIFSFFRPKKRSSLLSEKHGRIPMKEISINCIPDCASSVIYGKITTTNLHHASSGIKSYSSTLVSKTFQPISSRHKSQGKLDLTTKKSGVTQAICQLKERLSIKKVLEREKENSRREYLLRQEENDQIPIVRKESKDLNNSFEKYNLFDYGPDFSIDCVSHDHFLQDIGSIHYNHEYESLDNYSKSVHDGTSKSNHLLSDDQLSYSYSYNDTNEQYGTENYSAYNDHTDPLTNQFDYV